jgi:hypothetical protein
MRHQDSRMIDLVFESFTMPMMYAQQAIDLYRPWGKFFSPLGDPRAQISISID